jgi:plastocyanin
MRRSIIAIVVLGVVSLSACASGGATKATATEPSGPHLSVVAKDIAFDTKELKMTANQPTVIFFTNADSAPHNIAIYPTKDANAGMFVGEIIDRGAIVYDVPAFEPGTYFFRCAVHPVMNGTVQVTP